MNRVLLLGASGQVGWELARLLRPECELHAPSRYELDQADLRGLRQAVRDLKPQAIVNAAAYTDVDRAETEVGLARRVNAEAPRALAEEAARLGSLLVHYSTDYVFDGEKGAPYTEADPPNPLNAYGRSKLEGEQGIQAAGGPHLILRTSWMYSLRRPCILTKVLAWAREKDTLRMAADQWGSPTWCRPLAEATARLMRAGGFAAERSGVYHLACRGAASRYELAKAALELDPHPEERRAREVIPAPSEDFPAPARRPRCSALDSSHFEDRFGFGLPAWQEALAQAMQGARPG